MANIKQKNIIALSMKNIAKSVMEGSKEAYDNIKKNGRQKMLSGVLAFMVLLGVTGTVYEVLEGMHVVSALPMAQQVVSIDDMGDLADSLRSRKEIGKNSIKTSKIGRAPELQDEIDNYIMVR